MFFPLFETLFNETIDKHNEPFSLHDQEYVLEHIGELDENGREIFYAIIRQDHIKRYPNSTNELPLSCKQMKSGMRVDFDKVPNHLKYILAEFITRHLKKMKEDAMFFSPNISNENNKNSYEK